MKIALWCVVVIICSICLWKAIGNDMHVAKMFTQDLRNRVVGARLQKDGIDPYFYTWKQQDGIRYYDPNNFDALLVSNITASPFMHHLLYPLADMPQSKVRMIWLMLQYAFLITMVVLCLQLATNDINRLLVIGFAIAFLFTEAWKHTVAAGQLYLLIPFLYFLFFYFFQKSAGLINAFSCGFIFIVLVLIRPNAIVAFLPFLFFMPQVNIKKVAYFILPVLCVLLLDFSSNKERMLWYSYKNSIDTHILSHTNGFKTPARVIETDPKYAIWEGMNIKEMEAEQKGFGFMNNTEQGNLFEVFRILFDIKLSPVALLWLSIITSFICSTVFYLYFRTKNLSVINVVFFGFCLYMISDLCSPIYRHQYYTVQWIMPLLLAGVYFSYKYWTVYLLVFAGLFLNILNIPTFHVEHTMGEYIWLAGFMLLSFFISDGNSKKIKSGVFINGK